MDDKIADVNERLNYLAAKRAERDDIVIALFKMLKDNLDNRMQLLTRLDMSNDHILKTEDEDPAGSEPSASAFKVSSLSKHKQKAK